MALAEQLLLLGGCIHITTAIVYVMVINSHQAQDCVVCNIYDCKHINKS